MKKILLVLILILFEETSHGQIRDKRIICDPDPTVINRLNRRIVNNKVVDSTYTIKILRCIKSSPLGLKFEAGYSRYFYNSETADWLGQHEACDIEKGKVTEGR
ncbi:MAG: hypothetical protein WCE64_16880 [Bacteroidales bacterium]